MSETELKLALLLVFHRSLIQCYSVTGHHLHCFTKGLQSILLLVKFKKFVFPRKKYSSGPRRAHLYLAVLPTHGRNFRPLRSNISVAKKFHLPFERMREEKQLWTVWPLSARNSSRFVWPTPNPYLGHVELWGRNFANVDTWLIGFLSGGPDLPRLDTDRSESLESLPSVDSMGRN